MWVCLVGSSGGSSSLGERFTSSLLGLLDSLGNELLVLRGAALRLGDLPGLESLDVPLALQIDRSDQTLDLRGCAIGLSVLLRGLPVNVDVLSDVVVLGKSKELADLGGSLRSSKFWDLLVGQTWNRLRSNLGDDEVQDREVWGDDAAPDGLPSSLSNSATVSSEALITRSHQDLDTTWNEATLLHTETLLVVSASNLEHITLPLVSKNVSWDFGCEPLVIKGTELAVFLHLDLLLSARSGVRDVNLCLLSFRKKERKKESESLTAVFQELPWVSLVL